MNPMSPSTLTADPVLEPLLHSPRFVEYVDQLQAFVADEAVRRERFYDDMTESEKVEFIEGEVIVHSPARAAHLLTKDNVHALLRAFVTRHGLGVVFGEKCLCVFPRNDYEPDVVFFGSAKSALFDENTMKFPVPDLAVEVLSDSTAYRDRGVKFRDFEAHAVAEYWIVDAATKIVEQYILRDGQFVLALKSGSGEIASVVVPAFRVPIRSFFDDAENLATLRQLLG